MLERIEEVHAGDGEILFLLAELREAERQPERAELLINQAIDAGFEQPEAYLKRARVREENHDFEGAGEDTRRVLESERVAPPMVREAIRRSARLGTHVPTEIVASAAVMSLELDGKLWLANTFNRSREDLTIAEFLWKQVLDAPELPANRRAQARRFLGMAYMGLARCSEAEEMFRNEGQDIGDLSIENAFNYGMAMWGVTGSVDTEAFRRVVELDSSVVRKKETSNHLQCMAIAYWAAGEYEKALDYVDRGAEGP